MNKQKILGIDYGRSKVGLAIAEGPLAEPMKVIRYKDVETLNEQIKKMTVEEQIEKVVVGVSEGEMGKESREFSLNLEKIINIPVETHDETLTSFDAQKKSQEAGIGRKKRHEMEDAYAAAIILQGYLDTTSNI